MGQILFVKKVPFAYPVTYYDVKPPSNISQVENIHEHKYFT